jgi:cytochrome c biogenesis protein CcmG/thiol:disulfide interchange protein DsbE
VINVWGSWCVECRVEHAVLTEFAQRGVVPVVGLNWKDASEDALRWLGQFGDPFAMIAHDPEGDTAIDFGVYGAPETFVVDAAGTIRYKHVGALSHAVIEDELMPVIREVTGAPK